VRTLIVLALIGVVGWALLRSLREQRRAWLDRLALAGVWTGETDGRRYRLELDGGPEAGRYRERSDGPEGRREEAGRWSVSGHTLHFEPDEAAPSDCELRLFAPGRIGLHGPGRERRVYERRSDNVVPLRRGAH
jgi:type II secretory pathway pseudopilin PulG